ncbi:hypothetical protein VHAB30_47180 [Variovorax boronicumulans]|nr:hypothetical protein VHAB30_47180 [Variovorax boronicumulans]
MQGGGERTGAGKGWQRGGHMAVNDSDRLRKQVSKNGKTGAPKTEGFPSARAPDQCLVSAAPRSVCEGSSPNWRR